ncbi:MAG: hypothetical protein Q4D16_10335 [Eubacteriales bacterium]|nr:hypothetical protein [Eubacteriales bacterium]
MRTHYWKTDMYRCFLSHQMLIAVLGVCAVHLLIPQQFSEPRISVFRSFNRAWGSNAMVMVYIFTTYGFGQSFSDDLEQGYNRYAIIRGNPWYYSISKCVCIFLSSIIAMSAGRMLFIFLMRLRYPWEASIGEIGLLIENGCLTMLLEKGHYITYFLLHGVWQGFWAAVLALLSALVSLHTVNRLLVAAFPAMAHHLLRRLGILLGGGEYYLDPDHVFLLSYNVRNNEFQSMVFGAGAALLLSFFISFIICRQYVRRVENG